jgi:uncharacterized protein YvpB
MYRRSKGRKFRVGFGKIRSVLPPNGAHHLFSISFAVTLCLVLSVATAFAAPIDIETHWSGAAVNSLIENGVVSGYPDGRFRPDHAVSREEAAAMLYGLASVAGNVTTQGALRADGTVINDFAWVLSSAFTDTGNRWSEEQISFLAREGIIHGYGDGSFLPTATLIREEFALMAHEYLKYKRELDNTPDATEVAAQTDVLTNITMGGTPVFSDTADSYAVEAIEKLRAEGILDGYPDGSFRPKNVITRAEIAMVLHKISGLSGVYPTRTLPDAHVTEAPYISQLQPVNAPVGCEAVSLLMALHGKGYALDVETRQFLDAMPKDPENPAKGFVGSPYRPDKSDKTRTTINPPKLAEFAKAYGNVKDISGSSTHELQSEILAGNLVVIYATLWWEKPYYRDFVIEGLSMRILSNNHAVLVNGYDRYTNSYHILDPYNSANVKQEYSYWIGAHIFNPIYDERRFALLVE